MEVVARKIEAEIGDVITLAPIGDVHDDASASDKVKFKDDLLQLKDEPNVYGIGLGDFGEWIGPADPRYVTGKTKGHKSPPWVDDHLREQYLTYSAIDWLALLHGNHELKILDKHGTSPMQRLADAMGVPFGGYSCWLGIQPRSPTTGRYHGPIRILANHGNWGGDVSAGYGGAMRWAQGKDGWDIFLYGHNHKTMWRPQEKDEFTSRLSRVVTNRHVIATGTFLRNEVQGMTTYSERKGYPASYVGFPRIKIKITGGRHLIKVEGGDFI